ncbi:MAG: aminotransferase class V-fold PLP-dependent enzyme, partial [Methylovirgula sp.]
MARAYLDHNATTPLRPAARAAMLAELSACGNPSSVHAEGRAARARLEAAREEIATLVGTAPKNVTFTSSATEALNLILTPHAEIAGVGPFDVLL